MHVKSVGFSIISSLNGHYIFIFNVHFSSHQFSIYSCDHSINFLKMRFPPHLQIGYFYVGLLIIYKLKMR